MNSPGSSSSSSSPSLPRSPVADAVEPRASGNNSPQPPPPPPRIRSREEIKALLPRFCPKAKTISVKCDMHVAPIMAGVNRSNPIDLDDVRSGEKTAIQLIEFINAKGELVPAIKFKCIRHWVSGIRSIKNNPKHKSQKGMNQMPIAFAQLLSVARPDEPLTDFLIHAIPPEANGYWLTAKGVQCFLQYADFVCDIAKISDVFRGVNLDPEFLWTQIQANKNAWTQGQGASFLRLHAQEICEFSGIKVSMTKPMEHTSNFQRIQATWNTFHKRTTGRNEDVMQTFPSENNMEHKAPPAVSSSSSSSIRKKRSREADPDKIIPLKKKSPPSSRKRTSASALSSPVAATPISVATRSQQDSGSAEGVSVSKAAAAVTESASPKERVPVSPLAELRLNTLSRCLDLEWSTPISL